MYYRISPRYAELKKFPVGFVEAAEGKIFFESIFSERTQCGTVKTCKY